MTITQTREMGTAIYQWYTQVQKTVCQSFSDIKGAGFILRTGLRRGAKPFVGIPEFLPQSGFDIAAKVEDSLSALP